MNIVTLSLTFRYWGGLVCQQQSIVIPFVIHVFLFFSHILQMKMKAKKSLPSHRYPRETEKIGCVKPFCENPLESLHLLNARGHTCMEQFS